MITNDFFAQVENLLTELEKPNTETFDTVQKQALLALENPDKFVERIQHWEYDVQKLEDRIEQLKKYIANKERWIEFIKNSVKNYMTQNEIRKISGPIYKITVSDTRGRVEIQDETLIPAEYKKTKSITTIDKEEIRKAIEQGVEVPGAKIVVGQSIRMGFSVPNDKPIEKADSKNSEVIPSSHTERKS